MLKFIYYIRKAFFTFIIVTFLLALGATFTSVHAVTKIEALRTTDCFNNTAVNTPIEAPAMKGYCIKEANGIIGIYGPMGDLMYTVEVYIKTLPIKDREMLKKGIFADSYGELIEILGDFTA